MLSDGKFSDATTWLTLEEAANYLKMGKKLEYRIIAVNKAGEGQPGNTVMVVL